MTIMMPRLAHAQQVTVKVPRPLPSEYLFLSKRWRMWAKKLTTKPVTLSFYKIYCLTTSDGSPIDKMGWLVVAPYSLVSTHEEEPWIPEEWFYPLDGWAKLRFVGLCDECGGVNLHDATCPANSL